MAARSRAGSELVIPPPPVRPKRPSLQESLRSIREFANMSDAQLTLLRRSMSRGNYRRGEIVFRQGDAGDSFYVVVGGEAEVAREENDAHAEDGVTRKVLATLKEGACFGERALHKKDVRYASVVATGAHGVQVMSICREDFEALFGSFANYLPDQH